MAKTKHRRQSGGFVMVLNPMMKSAAWRDLSGNAVKLLMHLMMLSKGNNGWGHKEEPGELFLGERDAAVAIGVSRNTASRVFEELIDHGFLRVVRAGHFQLKVRHSTAWRLTFQPYPLAHQGPTNEWRGFQPEQNSRAQKLNGTGAKIGPNSESPPLTGAKIGPVELKNGSKPPSAWGAIIEPHLDIPRDGSAPARGASVYHPFGWWPADRSFQAAAVALAIIQSAKPSKVVPFKNRLACELCGEPVRPPGRGLPKRFCSETCRKRAERQRAYRRHIAKQRAPESLQVVT